MTTETELVVGVTRRRTALVVVHPQTVTQFMSRCLSGGIAYHYIGAPTEPTTRRNRQHHDVSAPSVTESRKGPQTAGVAVRHGDEVLHSAPRLQELAGRQEFLCDPSVQHLHVARRGRDVATHQMVALKFTRNTVTNLVGLLLGVDTADVDDLPFVGRHHGYVLLSNQRLDEERPMIEHVLILRKLALENLGVGGSRQEREPQSDDGDENVSLEVQGSAPFYPFEGAGSSRLGKTKNDVY